jgi:hypothetical protein
MTQYRFPFQLDTITLAWGVVDADHPNGHRGTDFAPGGLDILAVSDGVVVRSEYQPGLGWVVTVQDADGTYWSYCHMLAQSPVAVGDTVVRGVTVMGTVGNTGSLTKGRHLHFVMSKTSSNPAYGSTIDPIPYITARLAGTSGGGTTPFPTTEEDAMCNPRVIKKSAKEGAEEWMLVSPLITGPSKKERGYRVTTDQATGFAWARLYAPQGAPHATLDRADYIKTQDEARVIRDEWIATMKLVNA